MYIFLSLSLKGNIALPSFHRFRKTAEEPFRRFKYSIENSSIIKMIKVVLVSECKH